MEAEFIGLGEGLEGGEVVGGEGVLTDEGGGFFDFPGIEGGSDFLEEGFWGEFGGADADGGEHFLGGAGLLEVGSIFGGGGIAEGVFGIGFDDGFGGFVFDGCFLFGVVGDGLFGGRALGGEEADGDESNGDDAEEEVEAKVRAGFVDGVAHGRRDGWLGWKPGC